MNNPNSTAISSRWRDMDWLPVVFLLVALAGIDILEMLR